MTIVRTVVNDERRPKRGAPSDERRYTAAVFFKVEPELKEAFNAACWKKDEFAAEVLRKLMQAYIEAAK